MIGVLHPDSDLAGRACSSAADIDAAIDLLIACRLAESIDFWPSACLLRAKLSDPATVSDSAWLWHDAAGSSVAFAMLWEGWTLLACVRPGWHSTTLERSILCWAAERAAQIAWNCGERVALCVPVRDDDRRSMVLLGRYGFRLEELRMHYLVRPLDERFAAPGLPAGFRLRPLDGTPEAATQLELHRQVFPGATMTLAERLQVMRNPNYKPDLDLVVEGPGGELVAFCSCSSCAEENARFPHSIGWIEMLGTHPNYRRRGLGRALLLAAMQSMYRAGIEQAWLRTASCNEPMRRLAAGCGFHNTYQICWYQGDEQTLEELYSQADAQPV